MLSVAILAQVIYSHVHLHLVFVMDQSAKLRRLDQFRRSVPDVSASALESILREAQRNMPDLSNRCQMRQARDMQVTENTEYGPLLIPLKVELLDGRMQDFNIINPFAQLHIASKRCPGFAKLLAASLATHPSTYETPWRFILYSDEVVPGNQLSFHNLRKCWAIYWSFVEFVPEVLCHEDAWFCMAAERSDRVKKLVGGMAQIFKVILEFLFAVGGHNLTTSGVTVIVDNAPVRIWSILEMILQDGGAHKQVFCIKGESGTKLCMLCRTLYSSASGIVNEETGEMCQACSLTLYSEMDFATNDEVRGTVRRLADVAANRPGELALRQQACGFNHNRMNLLLQPSLDTVIRPVHNMAHDWMHTLMVHGVFNTVMYLMLMALQAEVHDAVPKLHAYILTWKLPVRLGRGSTAALADALSTTRWKSSVKAKSFKCTASDGMSMYRIVASFIFAVYLKARVCVDECEAFMKLCDVLDQLAVVAKGGVTPKQLHDAVDIFLRACLKAGWKAFLHPKFHWLIHLAVELQQFGMLFTCWVHERKHKMVKRYLTNMRNTRSQETSILAEITCQHLHDLSPATVFDLTIGLRPPLSPCKDSTLLHHLCEGLHIHATAIGRMSKTARVSKFEVVSTDDVVVFVDYDKLSIGQIKFFVVIDGVGMAVIAPWRFHSKRIEQGTAELECSDKVTARPCRDICAACTYRHKENGSVQVILSCLHREGVR